MIMNCKKPTEDDIDKVIGEIATKFEEAIGKDDIDLTGTKCIVIIKGRSRRKCKNVLLEVVTG